jgi:hypothetical protein
MVVITAPAIEKSVADHPGTLNGGSGGMGADGARDDSGVRGASGARAATRGQPLHAAQSSPVHKRTLTLPPSPAAAPGVNV